MKWTEPMGRAWSAGKIYKRLKWNLKEVPLMSRRMRSYYYAVLGAIGGLVGWQVSDLLGLSFSSNLYVSEALGGALAGLCGGWFICTTEGIETRKPLQAVRSGGFSGLLGLAAGAIG